MEWCRTCRNSRRRSAAKPDRRWCANPPVASGDKGLNCAGAVSRGTCKGPAVNILLLSMPDSFEHMPPIAVRMPNGALTSLAGNLDPEHNVAVADLILVQDRVRETVLELVAKLKPQLVGLSVMTFQRAPAFKIAELIRSQIPDVLIAVGGYDPS